MQDLELLTWLKKIITIFESWNIYWKENYIYQFYSFLIQNQFFTAREIEDFLETGDDLQNLFEVIDTILVRNFLWDFPVELSELLDIYLYFLEAKWEIKRYDRLVEFFQNNNK